MKSKLTHLLTFLLVFLLNQSVEGQSRFPVHGRLSISQKMFEKPECTVNIQELTFTGSRSHSVGLGFGIDFGLNPLNRENTLWILQSSGYLFSVPIKYTARMPKDIHGFDRDVAWDFTRYAAGFEASLGIIRQTKLNETWDLRIGLGGNIQDMYINSSILQHSALISKDGQTQPTQVVGSIFDPLSFGTTPRQKQALQINAVYSIGFSKQISPERMFVIDLRICHSGQQIIEPFNFMFGDTSDFKYKKSYIGLDFTYRFSMNHTLSQFGVK
ncbi:MAG: hypothetical protein ACI8SE_001014 [Bacteroidia bacterium]|jgi:hypothetical protein